MTLSEQPVISVGFDVGTSTVKLAVIRETGPGEITLLHQATERTRRRNPSEVAAGLFDVGLESLGLKAADLAYVATTGEGEVVEFRTGHFYGMTTHARGGLFLEPEACAIIDIGALHTRAVLMDSQAKVLGYRMTSQCASGSGQFLENISRYLGVTIDEIGPLSLTADQPEISSSICAVLAETDVINLVSQGISIPSILKGIHLSMAQRYVRLLTSARAQGVVLVTGGLACDVGLMATLREAAAEQQAPLEFRTHPQSILAGAIGAAIWGAYRARKLALEPTGVAA